LGEDLRIDGWLRKDGKVIQTGTWVVSPDGKALTASYTGTNASGQQVNITAVYDKQ
jgi:hypothetical protein